MRTLGSNGIRQALGHRSINSTMQYVGTSDGQASEQRLLLVALRGGTDKELADELGISLATVKKHWLSIYSRVSSHLPSLFASRVAAQEEGGRGRQKKQHIIEYVREHPEELRPASP
jgi:DNA-binding NarL/FixJ family response regulator